MSIGQNFDKPKRVVVLVETHDGVQHAFEIDGGTARWEWAGLADGPELGYGSAGKVTVEGRFHRINRSGMQLPELSGTKEITDGQ